jgi:hypothetical protein
MKNNYTTEDIYNIYNKEILLYTKNINARRITNFTKKKEHPDWQYFEIFTKRVNTSNNQINPTIYIKSLINFFDGYFNLKLLSSVKAIKIYKQYIMENKYDNCYNDVLNSIKFIIKYMKDNNISCIDEYMLINNDIFPVFAQHFNNGSISKYFAVLIPDIKIFINNYPQDISDQFFKAFISDINDIKSHILCYPKIKKINDNLENIIKKYLN